MSDWRNLKTTSKQRRFLFSNGIDHSKMNRGQASDAIAKIIKENQSDDVDMEYDFEIADLLGILD